MVVGILVLMLSIAGVYTRRGSQQILLYREQAKLVAEVNRARSLSLQRVQGTTRVCGYGIHVSAESSFVLYRNDADSSGNCTDFIFSSDLEKVEVFELEPPVRFLTRDVSDILFSPPNLNVYFDGHRAAGEATLVFGIPDQSSRSITINSGGQIVVR